EEKRKEEKERIEARLAYLKGQYDKIKKMQEAQTAGRDEITVKEKVLFGEIEDLKKTIDLLRQKIDALNSEKKGKEIFLRQMTNLTSSVKEKPSPLRRLIDLISIDEWTEKAVERFFFREMEYTVITEEDIDEIVSTIGKNDDNYIFFHDKSLFSYSGDEKEGKVGIHIQWIDSVEDTLKRIKDGEEGIFINNEMLIDSRGLILKEKDSSKIDLQQYRERKKAEKEIKDIQANLERHMESLNEYKRQFEIKDKAHRQLRTELKAKEDAIKRYDLDAAALAAEIKTISERCEELESLKDLYEEETSTRQIEGLMEDKRRLTQEKDLIEKELESLRNRLDAVKRTYEETLSKWRSISVNLERKKNLIKGIGEDMARKTDQIEHIKVELEELGDKSEQTDKKVKECLLKIERLERDYEDIKTTTGRYIERYEGLKETSGNLHMERQSIAEKVEMTLKDMEKIKSRRESLEKEIAVFDEKRKTIQERLATSYGLQVLEGITVLPIAELEAEREKIEEEIKALGEVNFRAEKEYVETKERMEFLATQKNDLKDSMDSLKKTIIKIDTISKEIFLETFDTVNNAFKRFTNMLFKGGNGHLLFNQESAGIDMFVQLPGKKVLRMEQLSGGEKALISTAFLLSLMDTNPSPFTLLDEIDAPLDDANIISLLHIIKTITDKTQIIFITHNRITMEASNTIYGITMEEPGISKIVSVRL
ncbi:MAG TPA: hypothetical protein PK864_06260, partial [Syntrophorhabdaceae bacterium]|nr:hypothetical protein [Syntrophorhabdaceae bacterium]